MHFSAPQGLQWEELDDEYIVFNPLSDEVHRLNPAAAAVLAELEAGPLSPDQLTQRLASMFDTGGDTPVQSQLRDILVQFDQVGLVFPTQTIAQRPWWLAIPWTTTPPPSMT
jgi:PqqD family protein of HPr-rel-A system